MKRLLWTAILLGSVGAAEAAFEDMGAGARAPGMGNAFSAIADDVYAIHYNPAGLATLERPQLGLTYAQFYMGLADSSNLGQSDIAYAHPLKRGRWGTLGLAWKDFKLNSIYNERTIALSYGRLLYKREGWGNIFAGLNFKHLNRSFAPGDEAGNAFLNNQVRSGIPDPVLSGSQSKTAYDTDVGLLYRTPRRYSFALSVSHLNQPDVGFAGTDKLPMRTKLGFGFKSLWMNLAAELGMQKSPKGTLDQDAVLAGERFFPSFDLGTLGVRAGLAIGSREFRQISIGLSYIINKIQADYAFLMPISGVSGTAGTHRMGLSFHFGAMTSEEQLSKELVSKMQNLRKTPFGYESNELSNPANLDRPELQGVKDRIEAGEFLMAYQILTRIMSGLPEDPALAALAKRLDLISASFPEIRDPQERWQVAIANGSRAFAYGKDRRAMLLVSYAASLNHKELKLPKYLDNLEHATQIQAERPSGSRNLLEEKHASSQSAFDSRNYQNALDDARDAMEIEPGDVRSYKQVGSAFYMMRYYPEAIAIWTQALKMETAPVERAALERYIAEAQKALGAAPQQPAQQPPLPERPVRRVEAPGAIAVEPSIPQGPADPRLIEKLYQQGMEHYARGENVLATAAFQRILALDPGNAQAQKALQRVRRGQ